MEINVITGCECNISCHTEKSYNKIMISFYKYILLILIMILVLQKEQTFLKSTDTAMRVTSQLKTTASVNARQLGVERVFDPVPDLGY